MGQNHSCYFSKDAFEAMTKESKYAENKELMIIPDAVHTDLYDGAKFSYDGDFLGYLGLEDMGIFTNHDKGVIEKISEMVQRM